MSAMLSDMDQATLAALHDCLTPPNEPEQAEERVTIRLKASTKHKLRMLCDRHGLDMSTFFRQCAEKVTAEVG